MQANQGFVYFIAEVGNDEYVKIGKSSKSVSGRMQNLQCGNPRRLYARAQFQVDDCGAIEAALHKIFKIQRFAGEWFRYQGKVERFLSHATEYGIEQAVLEYTIDKKSLEYVLMCGRGKLRHMETEAPKPKWFEWSETKRKDCFTLPLCGLEPIKTAPGD